ASPGGENHVGSRDQRGVLAVGDFRPDAYLSDPAVQTQSVQLGVARESEAHLGRHEGGAAQMLELYRTPWHALVELAVVKPSGTFEPGRGPVHIHAVIAALRGADVAPVTGIDREHAIATHDHPAGVRAEIRARGVAPGEEGPARH